MLTRQTILNAFAAVGRALRINRDVEILIVGSAAGILTGELPQDWATGDVDLIWCHLPFDRDEVLDTAAAVTIPLGLTAGWLNDFSGLFRWNLPVGWEQRRVRIGVFDHLIVSAVSRIDLITMKFLSRRSQDRDQLTAMRVRQEELVQVVAALDALEQEYPEHKSALDQSRYIISVWSPHL